MANLNPNYSTHFNLGDPSSLDSPDQIRSKALEDIDSEKLKRTQLLGELDKIVEEKPKVRVLSGLVSLAKALKLHKVADFLDGVTRNTKADSFKELVTRNENHTTLQTIDQAIKAAEARIPYAEDLKKRFPSSIDPSRIKPADPQFLESKTAEFEKQKQVLQANKKDQISQNTTTASNQLPGKGEIFQELEEDSVKVPTAPNTNNTTTTVKKAPKVEIFQELEDMVDIKPTTSTPIPPQNATQTKFPYYDFLEEEAKKKEGESKSSSNDSKNL